VKFVGQKNYEDIWSTSISRSSMIKIEKNYIDQVRGEFISPNERNNIRVQIQVL